MKSLQSYYERKAIVSTSICALSLIACIALCSYVSHTDSAMGLILAIAFGYNCFAFAIVTLVDIWQLATL